MSGRLGTRWDVGSSSDSSRKHKIWSHATTHTGTHTPRNQEQQCRVQPACHRSRYSRTHENVDTRKDYKQLEELTTSSPDSSELTCMSAAFSTLFTAGLLDIALVSNGYTQNWTVKLWKRRSFTSIHVHSVHFQQVLLTACFQNFSSAEGCLSVALRRVSLRWDHHYQNLGAWEEQGSCQPVQELVSHSSHSNLNSFLVLTSSTYMYVFHTIISLRNNTLCTWRKDTDFLPPRVYKWHGLHTCTW